MHSQAPGANGVQAIEPATRPQNAANMLALRKRTKWQRGPLENRAGEFGVAREHQAVSSSFIREGVAGGRGLGADNLIGRLYSYVFLVGLLFHRC